MMAVPEAAVEANTSRVVFESATIARRLDRMAAALNSDWQGRELYVVGLLHGAVPFVCDLIRRLRVPLQLDFLSISRYRGGDPSQGVRLTKDLQEDVCDRHVLLLDVLIDTGFSLDFVHRLLLRRGPASVTVGTLLARPTLRLADLPLRYLGFEIEDDVLVGYGLDYQGRHRQLPDIRRL